MLRMLIQNSFKVNIGIYIQNTTIINLIASFFLGILVALNFINNNILLPTGNIWISDVLIYHLFLVILITTIFSLIFNKLIIVFIRGWLRKLNFNIGKQLLEKKVLVPIGWAIPIIIFEAGLGSYSPEEGVISRLMKSLIDLNLPFFSLSLTTQEIASYPTFLIALSA